MTTQMIKVVREIPGQYLRENELYIVTRCESGRGNGATAYFQNVVRGSGTTVPEWAVRRALSTGSLELA